MDFCTSPPAFFAGRLHAAARRVAAYMRGRDTRDLTNLYVLIAVVMMKFLKSICLRIDGDV